MKKKNLSKEQIILQMKSAYNEYKYFHEYVRDTLFNKTTKDKLFDSGNDQPISLYYEREVLPSDEMIIFVRVKNNGKEEIINYPLKVEHLSLRIFETGIGILTLTLYNYCKTDIDSVLRINDYGRRIYPQFLGEQNQFSPNPIDTVKNSFLPGKIVFKAGGINEEDNFETNDYLSEKKHFAKYIEELLKPFHDNTKNKLAISPIIDDRMFVVCWHENESEMKRLKTPVTRELNNTIKDEFTEVRYKYENDSKWYQYIFVDGNVPLVQNVKMKKDLIEQTTYPRFIDWGTLFGISRYSLMCLCGKNYSEDEDFRYRIIRNHMQKMYYQMCVLLLAQRSSIIQFNNELEEISLELRADEGIKQNNKNDKVDDRNQSIVGKLKKLEQLNSRVINFRNRLVFDEITPQEQGIELYKMALENMNIPQQIKALTSRISDLHLTADQIYERINHDEEVEQSKIAKIITVIGAIFLPLTLFNILWKFDFDLFLPLYLVDDKLLGSYYGLITGLYKVIWFIVLLSFLFVFTFTLINNLTFEEEKNLAGKKIKFKPLNAIFSTFKIKKDDSLKKWKIGLWILLVVILILILIPPILKIFDFKFLRFLCIN